MDITYRINGVDASPAEQCAFRVGYKTARDEYEKIISELDLDIESLQEQLKEAYRNYFNDVDLLKKENAMLKDQVKEMKIDPWFAQSQRDLTLIHPHPYSSAIDGNWLFVFGYDNPVLYWRLR